MEYTKANPWQRRARNQKGCAYDLDTICFMVLRATSFLIGCDVSEMCERGG